MTRICVPIFVDSAEQAKRDVARAVEAGADLVELRLDDVADASLAREILSSFAQTSFVLTRRAERQGGHNADDDADRIQWLADARGHTDAYVDIEADSAVGPLRYWLMEHDAQRTILSAHDFKTRPADLTKTFVAMQESTAAVAKLAWQARSIRDNIEAFELMRAGPKPTIAICMGEAGAISRILARKFGAFLTFASLSDTAATAPGQLTIADLKSTYRWDAIGANTKVYGVVGSPVAHSMSPAIHNTGFDAIGFDGVYVPLLVQPGYESFKAFMETFRAFEPLNLAGLSITIPHKENALRYAREHGFKVDEMAERIGVVNSYALGSDGVNYATSTDHDAILHTIVDALSAGRSFPHGMNGLGILRDLRVAVVGAGGTGRTAVAGLAHYGARVTIVNRTRDRAEALAAEFGATPAPLEAIPGIEADVWVNTTSLGMSPNVETSIFDAGIPKLNGESLVFDTVYNPPLTKLLRQARDAGARTASGVEMFLRQAEAQFCLWTNGNAPSDVMRRVVETRLSALQTPRAG